MRSKPDTLQKNTAKTDKTMYVYSEKIIKW